MHRIIYNPRAVKVAIAKDGVCNLDQLHGSQSSVDVTRQRRRLLATLGDSGHWHARWQVYAPGRISTIVRARNPAAECVCVHRNTQTYHATG